MVQIQSGDPHGLIRVMFGLVGQDGRCYGTAGPSLANGSSSSMYVANYPKTCELPLPDRPVIDFTGSDRWQGSYQYGATSLGSFNLTMENIDAALIAMVTGGNVDLVTNLRRTMYSEDVLREELPQCCVILSYRIQARGGDNDGGNYYIHSIIPRAWVAPRSVSGAPGFQAAGEYGFQITPTSSKRLPHGLTFADTDLQLQDDRGVVVHMITDNPIHVTTFIGNGTLKAFNLPYLPIDAGVTLNDTYTEFATDGDLVAPFAVNPTTGALTIVDTGDTAPAAATFHSTIYETRFRTAA